MSGNSSGPETRPFSVGDIKIGGGAPPVLLCGLCIIESRDHTLRTAERIGAIADRVGVPFIFKASYDKANRSSHRSYRGPGLEEGLAILADVRSETGRAILTDIHDERQIAPTAEIADILQIPAFLCRQTDLVMAAGASGRPINVKKAQYMAPEDMTNVVAKLEASGCHDILLTDRGTAFGYRMLISDFRALPVMRSLGYPVCYDATHSVQLPGGTGDASGGRAEMIPYLARAAAAVGIDALFMETHEDPSKALSDGPNALPIDQLEGLLRTIKAIDESTRA